MAAVRVVLVPRTCWFLAGASSDATGRLPAPDPRLCLQRVSGCIAVPDVVRLSLYQHASRSLISRQDIDEGTESVMCTAQSSRLGDTIERVRKLAAPHTAFENKVRISHRSGC